MYIFSQRDSRDSRGSLRMQGKKKKKKYNWRNRTQEKITKRQKQAI